MSIAGALANTVYLPLTAYLAAHLGWRDAIRVQAATLTAAFAVAAIFIPAAPASPSGPARQPAGAALAAAWKSPAVRAWVLVTLLAGRLPLGPAVRLLGIRGALAAATVLAAAAAVALVAGGHLPAAVAHCLLGGISL